MQRLRLLQLNHVHLRGSFDVISKEIRWLCWHGFPQKCLPDDFNCEKMVVIDMQYSRLKHVWKGRKFVGWLKFLNLSHSYRLVHTPDFHGVPNLERISLKFCTSLIEVHESIVKLKGLLMLNLKGCRSLRKLPKQIHQLKSLKELIISGCSKLDKLPEELDGMASLQVLDADGISQSLSGTLGLRVWHIFPFWVSKLRRSPAFTWPSLPQSLTMLTISEGNISDHGLPKNMGSLSSLYWLDLSHNPIRNIPESIKQLKELRHLNMTGCNKLLTVLELPHNLQRLSIAGCKSLKRLTSIPNLSRDFCLLMFGCPKLVEVEQMFRLQPVEKIGVEIMQNLGLDDIEPVRSLNVKLLNLMTWEANYFPIQGLLEFGIFSIFLPGSNIPDWFSNYRNVRFSIQKDSLDEDVHSVSFSMPSLPNIRFRGLNIGVVYSSGNQGGIYHLVANRTKDIGWVYSPTFTVAANEKDVIFLSHWNVENLFEVGDELDIRLSGLPLKKIEIQLVYDQEHVQDNQFPSHICFQNHIDNGNLSRYEFSPGRHFLCHYQYMCFQYPGWIVFWVVSLLREQSKSVLNQYLGNSLGLQDSQHIRFGPDIMLGRAYLHPSYILQLVCPLLVAVDYHLRRGPSPISGIVAEMTTLVKWLICCPDFVLDSNFVEGCLTIALAWLELVQGSSQQDPDIFKKVLNKIYGANKADGQNLVLAHKHEENMNQWQEDGANKVDVLVHGTDGIGKIIIAKFVYNLKLRLFEACSFPGNTKETSEELNGLVYFEWERHSHIFK